jgi:hypothetical protein
MWPPTTMTTFISAMAGGGGPGKAVGIDQYTMIRDGSFTMVCRAGMAECIPAGETTTATTCGDATDGTTAQYLMAMFITTGKAGKAAVIGGMNRIEALPAATVLKRSPVGASEALDRNQGAHRLRQSPDKALILAGIEVPLGVWGEEAMQKHRATVVSRAARACLHKGRAVRARAMWVRAMLAVTVKG